LELAVEYNAANPFPHVVIDNFLPAAIVDMCIDEFYVHPIATDGVYNRDQERLKREIKPDFMSDSARRLFYSFNSRPFISIIENITGIKGLIPDPYYFGAGFHEIFQAGHLSIHADFNYHKPLNLERRINVLIYLNPDWKDEYGGQLELWDKNMSKCAASITPILNRCVVFNTTSDSNHGNPNPINHPEQLSRKSIALYYYTSTWKDENRIHTTQFRTRPRTEDKFDWQVRLPEIIHDFAPPVAIRASKRIKKFIRR
jgi:hypothetical protein